MGMRILEQHLSALTRDLKVQARVVDLALARDISVRDKETVKTIIKKRTSLIDNRPTLKVLKTCREKETREKGTLS